MLGAAGSLAFANVGAAFGTAKAGVAVAHLGIVQPGRVMRGIVPVVMAGILGIYGLIVSVIISNNMKTTGYMLFSGYMHLGAGLAAGIASLAAGYAIGIVGDICCLRVCQDGKDFCSNDSYAYLCRGPRPVRPHYCSVDEQPCRSGHHDMCVALNVVIVGI
ncbi:putative vacuolar ATP synthase 16 kDa proteolipid subunit [Trypanosoma cruzi]|nr:putative vacuolar ATP synthase 16 kDa proteolipid subunit [Trypanosoma cruzi]